MLSPQTCETISQRLEKLAPGHAAATLAALNACIGQRESSLAAVSQSSSGNAANSRWSEQDVVLITYADQVCQQGLTPLASLAKYLDEAGWTELINTVHILPFYPFTSDDGFSVSDYTAVNPEFGGWDDVATLGQRQRLMFDFVCNHMSAQSAWFRGYLAGEAPYDGFFIEADPELDHSAVVRPRSSPLLTPVETSRGTRHVWTTFSADQVDLNFANPALLVEMVGVLLDYVARGARIVRLDAIAYLWKQHGTTCIHLEQTHEVVKLMRDILNDVSPHVLILTETNVPHAENVSYFGDGDEAHMVYQFSLPPLLLDAMLSGDTTTITSWLESLAETPAGTTFFNFGASHDGIGVRPLEGLVSDQRLQSLAQHARSRGGFVGMRSRSDGSESPYELNITYFDALGDCSLSAELHARRFLTSQAVVLALRGIPGIYFHSLVGTPNDVAAAEASGIRRRINRRKFQREELDTILADASSPQSLVHAGYRQMLAVRTRQPAFHPDAPQRVLPTGTNGLLAIERTSATGQRIVCLANFTATSQQWQPPAGAWQDLLAPATQITASPLQIPAYGCAWLSSDD